MWNLFRRRPLARAPRRRARLGLELLESRLTPSTMESIYTPVIVAGDDTGSPADSPAIRVDSNQTTSPFTGVGSVQVSSRRGTYIGTGTVLTDSSAGFTYVLTAGHVVDVNGDGKFNSKDGVTSLTFWFNVGGNQTGALSVSGSALGSAVFVNPSYTGFNRPSVNDDMAIIRFSGSPPAGVQSYSVYEGGIFHHVLTMVGYGRSGYGDGDYTTNASWSIKRIGQNVVDAFYGQDDAGQPAANEVFRFDFDGPTASTNYFGDGGSVNGGLTLGNNVETTLGGGDSGGPSFVWVAGVPIVAGVNTFTQGSTAPRFGSLGGGIVVGSYLSWLQSVVPGLSSVSGALTAAPTGISGTGNQASLLLEFSLEMPAGAAPIASDSQFAALLTAATSFTSTPVTPVAVLAPAPIASPAAATPVSQPVTLSGAVVPTIHGPKRSVGLLVMVNRGLNVSEVSDARPNVVTPSSFTPAEQPATHAKTLLAFHTETNAQLALGLGKLLAEGEKTLSPDVGWYSSDSSQVLAMLTAVAMFTNVGEARANEKSEQSAERSRTWRQRV